MLSNKTIKRILDNKSMGLVTIIGRYTYKVSWDGHSIQRVLTDDAMREWIDSDGRRFGAWVDVQRI